MKSNNKRRGVLPGFGLAMGYTVLYLSLIVLLPLGTLLFKSSSGGWEFFWKAVADPRAVASYKLTFGASLLASLLASLVNVFFGLEFRDDGTISPVTLTHIGVPSRPASEF